MRTKIQYVLVLPIVLALFAGALVISAQIPPAGTVTLVWPGDNALNRLEKYYGKAISYEDPVWVWRGELAPNPRSRVPTGDLEPPRPAFTMPQVDSGSGVETDLAGVLSAFHRTTGIRFVVQSSKLGLHVIPTLVHDENGALVSAKNLLDAFVVVPVEQRSAYDHFNALCAAIARATGVKIRPGIDFKDGWNFEFGADPSSFTWGANSETGREAIIDLLDRSASSMSWHLLCWTGPDSLHDHTCALNIREVAVSITDSNGKPKDTILLFDRCGKCPPLSPPLQRQLPPKR